MCHQGTRSAVVIFLLISIEVAAYEREKSPDPGSESMKITAVPYLHVGLGLGISDLRSLGDNTDDHTPVPTFAAEIGFGAFLSRFGLEVNFRYTGFAIYHVFQINTAFSYFPHASDMPWFLKCELGYFYQQYQFESDNPPSITQGIPFVAGLGWCWKPGVCIGLDYIYNLSLYSSAEYHDNTNYAEHTVIFLVSYKSTLPGKAKE